MAEMYFIGGAPRSGKTTVMQEFLRTKPILAASTDAIRSVAKSLLSPEVNPALHKTARDAFGSSLHKDNLRNNPNEVLEQELGEAAETWKSVLHFISYYQQDVKDSIIEGVAVLPHMLADVNFKFKAVFIANLTDQTDTILTHARNNPEDWLNKYDDETIRLYASFNRLWNEYYATEASKYGFPVVEIHQDDFQVSVKRAVNILLTD